MKAYMNCDSLIGSVLHSFVPVPKYYWVGENYSFGLSWSVLVCPRAAYPGSWREVLEFLFSVNYLIVLK